MNERLTAQHESHEKLDLESLAKENLQRARQEAGRAESDHHQEVEHIRQQVHEQAVSGREYTVGENESSPASHSFGTHKALKAQSYKQTLASIRRHLSKPEKRLSKVIHGQRVEKVSNVGAQTIARPIGLATGGLCAFVGSVVVLYLSRRYGFTYNFSLFLILFAGGYLAGSLLEFIVKLLKRRT